MERKAGDISWASLWRIFFFVLLVTLLVLGRKVLVGLFLAVVISSGLEFIVTFLEKRRIPRTMGVILIFLAAALAVIITVYTIIPLLIVDVNTAFSSLTKITQNSWWAPIISLRTSETLKSFMGRISGGFLSGSVSPFDAFSDVVGSVALAFSIIVASFYLSLSRDGVERFILAVFPQGSEKAALKIYERSIHRIGIWFRTQIILSFLMGVLVLVALVVLGVKHAFLIAILTAVFEIVPYVGPIVSGSVGVISALITSPSLAFYTLIVFLVIHQIESHIMVPLLFGRNVGLHPVIVIAALLMGIEVGGFLGVLISVPAAVVIQEITEEWGAGRRRQTESLPV